MALERVKYSPLSEFSFHRYVFDLENGSYQYLMATLVWLIEPCVGHAVHPCLQENLYTIP